MQFASNNFIISTVALLSLITPGVNADVAVITTPATGSKWMAYSLIYVEWYVVRRRIRAQCAFIGH